MCTKEQEKVEHMMKIVSLPVMIEPLSTTTNAFCKTARTASCESMCALKTERIGPGKQYSATDILGGRKELISLTFECIWCLLG
jgi:hypothetical protein